MTIPAIGLENMPNIYFSNISIENNYLEATLTTKDFIDNPTWSKSEILRGNLKIKVVAIVYDDKSPPFLEAGENQVTQLNNGAISLHEITDFPVREMSIYSYDENETKIIDNLNNFYYTYRITSKNLDLSKSNIYLYALTYIDLRTFNLNYADYKFLDGPMTSEVAKEKGNTPIKASLFRTQKGVTWPGPVHNNDGVFMEGSYHQDKPHGDLTKSEIESKVSDFMLEIVREESLPEGSTLSEKMTFLYFQNELNTSGIICDLVNVALNEIQTAQQLYNTNQDYFYDAMKDFRISRFEIRKAPIKQRIGFLDIGTHDWIYDDMNESVLVQTSMVDGKFEENYQMKFYNRQFSVNPNNLIEINTSKFDIKSQSTFDSSTKVGHIKELSTNELFLKNLILVDEQYFTESSEDYKLKVFIDFTDNFKPRLVKSSQKLDKIISELELTYNGLFGKVDNTRVIGFFAANGVLIDKNFNFVSIESNELFKNSIFERVSAAARNVLLAMLRDDQVIQAIINNILQNLYINVVSKENFNIAISFLNDLSNKFINKYDLGTRNNKSRLSTSRTIKIEMPFADIIKIKHTMDGSFNFFNKKQDNPVITAEDFIDRSNAEFNKFFDREITARDITRASSDVDEKTALQMADFSKSKYSFFTPVSFVQNDKSYDLASANITIFDQEKHQLISNHKFKLREHPKRKRHNGRPAKRKNLGRSSKNNKKKLLSTLNIRNPFKVQGPDGKTINLGNARDYLGSTSLFLSTNLGTRRKNIEESKSPTNIIRNVFSQDKKINSFKEISLNNETSILLKNKNLIDFSIVPLQFRALILSNYGLSRFSFAIEEDNLIENDKFSNIINNVYSNVRTAKYIDGFVKNKKGLRDLNNPIIKLVDLKALKSEKTMMIKLDNFSNQMLQMDAEEIIPASNTLFMINGKSDAVSSPFIETQDIQIQSLREKEFSTTNVIAQFKDRNQLVDVRKIDVDQVSQTPTNGGQSKSVSRRQTNSLRPVRSGYNVS